MESLSLSRGFTLIELLVVLVIITIITSVAITSQGSFNKSLILSNAAYDLALTIRSAETFGLGSRAQALGVNAGYGLHFQAGTTGSFILFADTYPVASCSTPNCNSGNHSYQNSGVAVTSDISVQTYTLGNKISISNFCAFDGAWRCASGTSPVISSLDIVFERPNPNALMSKDGSYNASNPVTIGCIILTSLQGGTKYITVGSSGQIITNATAQSCGFP